MKVFVNGEEIEIEIKTLKELVEHLNIENQTMAAAVNMEIVKKSNWQNFKLKENDNIELLRFVGGG